MGISDDRDLRYLSLFADGLALVYHEARNARHLVKGNYLLLEDWAQLCSLPTERVDAWRELRTLREDAAGRPSASEASHIFSLRFRKSLPDLRDLYSNPHWKHAGAYGGHAWIWVTELLHDLGLAIDSGDSALAAEAAGPFMSSRHNTGFGSVPSSGVDCPA